MNIPPLKGHVDPTTIAPDRLAGNPSLTKDQKIAEASRQFEIILLKQILAASQKTVIHSKYSDDSMASGIYHDMITNELADDISKSHKFGIAKMFEQQLERHTHKTGDAPAQQAADGSKTSHGHTTSAGLHSAAQILKPLHERTFAKSH